MKLATYIKNLDTSLIDRGSITPYLQAWQRRSAYLKLIYVQRPRDDLAHLHPGFGTISSGNWQSITEKIAINETPKYISG